MTIIKHTTASLVFLLILLTSCLVLSCNGCKNDTQPKIKLTQKVEIKLQRFEKELFAISQNQVDQGIHQLYKKYGAFYISYARDVLKMPYDETDTLFIKPMKMLLGFKPLIDIQQAVDSAFKDVTDIETQLSYAMSVYKQEFPTQTIPDFITFISEFGFATITYENAICIGLDMYMNKRYIQYYRAYEFPEFMIRKLHPYYIAPNAIKALAIRNYEYQSIKDKRFLATMISEGKVRYFTKALLPDVHDSIIMGYTAQQLKWSQENEPQMWTHFIDKNLLFNNESSQFIRYFNDGPFTSADGVPANSSPMIGTWAGLQIVRNYMKENPTVTLQQLMDETNFDKILKLSKYRPK